METIRQLFPPETLTHLAQETGFIQRKRSLAAEAFLTLCAWGDGSLAQQSLQRLCTSLTLRHDCSLFSEGLNQRFTERAVAFLREVFFFLLQRQRPLLWSTIQTYRTCFTRLRILDSTSFLASADYGGITGVLFHPERTCSLNTTCCLAPVFNNVSNPPMIQMPVLPIMPNTRFYGMTYVFGI
ncbi:hypothetical protein [Geobacillus subterraneus]|uniref:hypothetical protein n=1 Tax=Geobacillus subterraneus TaxID=129338 RepID=UPI0017BDF80E